MDNNNMESSRALNSAPDEIVEVAPSVDVIEQDGQIKVYLDMPGVSGNEASVNVDENLLKIRGNSTLTYNNKKILFVRDFTISDEIDLTKTSAKCRDGVMELTLPKHYRAKTHRIEIQN